MIRQKPPLQPQTRGELIKLRREVETSEQQSRLGIYYLKSYYRSGPQSAPLGPLSDFVGPVEVRRAESNNPTGGRGLFATKDVKAGDLLLVSNPLVVSGTNPNGLYMNSPEDFMTRLIAVIGWNAFRRRQLYSLTDSTSASVSEVPPMTLFTTPVDSKEALAMAAEPQNAARVIDLFRLSMIVRTNVFQGKRSSADSGTDGPMVLHALPSMINHSCVPNAQSHVVGHTMFFRATRDIPKGEVTIPYLNAHQTVLEREVVCKMGFNFQCRCPRCIFERSFTQAVPELIGLAHDSARLFGDSRTSIAEVAAAGTKIAIAVEEILGQASDVDALGKNWIRASFGMAYMCRAFQLMQIARKTDHWEPWIEAMNCRFDMMLSVTPSADLLMYVGNAIHHVPASKTCRATWTQLAKKLCTLLMGPMDKTSLDAQVNHYCEIPFFRDMGFIPSDWR